MVIDEFAWMERGNCRGKPTDWWFDGDSTRARALCASCPVAAECLEYALTDKPAPVGIWAGTDERERSAIRRERHKVTSATAAA